MSIRSTAYVRRLEEAGVDPKVARAHAEALEELVMGDYVTKDYLDARLTALESKIETRFSALDSKIETRFSALDGKIEARFSALDSKSGSLRSEIASVKGELENRMVQLESTMIKWMVGQGLAIVALLLTLERLLK